MILTLSERLRYWLDGFKSFVYPPRPSLPAKPWHPDSDFHLTQNLNDSTLAQPHPNSARFIAHLKATSTPPFRIYTGSAKPASNGVVNGYPLNAALPTDKLYTISRDPGPNNIQITTGFNSSYGAKVRYNSRRMMQQGNPMQGYSDSKLHIFDNVTNPDSPTITEIQNFRDPGNASLGLFADGATQYPLTQPSTSPPTSGRSSARLPLAEQTLRYDDVVRRGWVQRATLGVRAARHTYIYPALASDGPVGRPPTQTGGRPPTQTGPFTALPDTPDAPPMGIILKLNPAARTRLINAGITRTSHPQTHAILDCYEQCGIIQVDTGGHNSTALEPDPRWDQVDLSALARITLDDFTCYYLKPTPTQPPNTPNDYEANYTRDY